MRHTDTSPSKPIHTLSPCRTAQEVAETSKIMANQKILTQKVKELEFRLQQANYQNDRLQEQYDRATYDQGQLSHNLEDAANNISKLNAKIEDKDKRIHVLLKENEKVIKIVEKKESASRIEQRASASKDPQHKQQASKEDHLNDATLGILAKKRREELDLMTQMNTQNQLKIQNLQNKLNQLIEENAQLQKVIKGNTNRGDDLKQIIHNLESTHQNQLRQQSESHKQRINQLQQQHQQEMQLLKDEMQRKKKDLSSKVDKRFEESTYPFVQELKDAKNTIENQQKEITRLRIQQYKSHQGNADDLTLQFEKLNKKNAELSDQIFQLQQKSQKDELKLKTKIANLEKANEQLQQIHNHNQHQLDDLQQQATYMPQYKDKTVENVKLQLDNTKLSCEAENQIKKLKDKIHQLNTELNEKCHNIDELKDQVRQLTFEKDNAIQNTRLECAQDIKTLQDRMKDEMSQQANMYNQAQKPFQDQLKQAALENQKQKQTIHRQSQEIGNMENKLTELLGNQEEMQRSIQKEKAYQDYLNTEKQKLKDKLQQIQKESEKDQEKINQLQQNLQKVQSEKKESQQMVDALKAEVKKITSQLEIVGEKNDDLNNKLDQFKQESRSFRKQFERREKQFCIIKELQMNINNLLTTQIPPVGQWLNTIKQGGDFKAQNELGKQPRLKYINVYKIENLQFPPELDTYKTSFKLRFAATIYDTRNEIFISNTYQSPFLPLFVNDIINLEDMEDDDDQSHSMKSNKQIKSALQNKNTGNYSHAGFWVAFIINKETYLKDYKLAIEITLHQYDNLEKRMEGSKTLGYTLIDLETKLKTSDLYGGSVREINQGYYLREQKLLPQYLSYEWKKSAKVTDLILRLIGPFMVFGMEDIVCGLKGEKMPQSLKDMINLEFDVGLDIKFTQMQFKVNKIVEFDLRQYLIEQQIELTKIREVKVTRLNQYGVLVCHNGWKAINQSEYENTFKLNQVDKENDKKFDYFDTIKEHRLDRIFNKTVALIQLYYILEIEVAEIKQDPITYNIGYAVISPKSCNKYTGKLTINILTGPPVFSSKNNLQYYCKHQTKGIGEIEIVFLCPQLSGIDNPMVDKTKDDQDTIQMKNQIIQMQKGNDSGNSLKDRLVNQSIKKKLQIKTGLAKTETQQRQTKLVNDIQEIKQNTSNIVLDMIDKGFKAQHKVQSLLYDFSGLLEVGEQNFTLAKDKYIYQERKLIEYQDRKQKLDQIDISQSMIQQQNFNKWQYSKLIPQNLEIFYVSSYKEYLNQIQFGVRDVPSNRQQQMIKENPKGRENLRINVQFHTYKNVMKLWANQARDDYILPSIYQFNNTCPTQLDISLHILGQEIKLENALEQVNSLKQYETCIKDKFYFKKQTIGELIIEKRSLVDERVIMEIWDSDSKILIGRSFIPLYQNILIGNENTVLCNQTKECDILGQNGKSVIGLMDVSVLVQYTDMELMNQKKKNLKTTIISQKMEQIQEHFDQIYVPPNNYHDVIRLYYGSESEYKLIFFNPLLYELQYLGQMKDFQLKGHPKVKLLYYEEQIITILVNIAPQSQVVVYFEIQDEKKLIQRFYKIIISNCESILYNYPIGNAEVLEMDYQSSLTDKIKIRSQNPYLANCNDQNIPIVQNSLFRIPIRCVFMEQENMDVLVTIQQQSFCKQVLVKFKPIERKVAQLFELRCQKNKSQSETIMYRNKSDAQQLVELSSSNPIMKIQTTVLTMLPYESLKITFLLEAYNSTKKQIIKLFINDAIHSYSDCLLFKLSYF